MSLDVCYLMSSIANVGSQAMDFLRDTGCTQAHYGKGIIVSGRPHAPRPCNDSACACRYILGNIEHTRGVRKGDRLWQLGFGGGFKCNSAVWKALRDIRQPHAAWAQAPGQG